MRKGFIQIIIIFVLLVIILSLLGVSLSTLFKNPILQENFGFIGDWIAWLWNNYLSVPFWYVYEIFIDLVWEPSLDILRGIKGGETNVTDVFK
ncbi:MAG: hypothetical protein AAB522_00390 [Patescibacteria group bacterium]